MSNLLRELIAGGWAKFESEQEIAYRLAAIVESSDPTKNPAANAIANTARFMTGPFGSKPQ